MSVHGRLFRSPRRPVAYEQPRGKPTRSCAVSPGTVMHFPEKHGEKLNHVPEPGCGGSFREFRDLPRELGFFISETVRVTLADRPARVTLASHPDRIAVLIVAGSAVPVVPDTAVLSIADHGIAAGGTLYESALLPL